MRTLIRWLCCILLLATPLMACKDSSTRDGNTKVFKYAGARQCEPNSGVPVNQMQLELSNQGIDVVCAQSGFDGNSYPAGCGLESGGINIYTIRTVNLPDAEALGFSSVIVLPTYQDQPCT